MDRPKWCPYPTICEFSIHTQNLACIGVLISRGGMPEPRLHGTDNNTHRLCFGEITFPDEEVKRMETLEINKTDMWNLRRIINAVFCDEQLERARETSMIKGGK